jgi:hypothetical protein
MKPDWDKLMVEFEGHASTLVADVDCTAAGKPLCDANGVKGFPTIKFGDVSALEDYKGGRDFASLQKHAKSLQPSCSVSNIDLCDDEQKAEISKIQAMSDADLDAAIAAGETQLDDAEKTFKSEVSKLQAAYEKLSTDKDDTIAAVKNSGLGMMKAVKAAKANAGKDEL